MAATEKGKTRIILSMNREYHLRDDWAFYADGKRLDRTQYQELKFAMHGGHFKDISDIYVPSPAPLNGDGSKNLPPSKMYIGPSFATYNKHVPIQGHDRQPKIQNMVGRPYIINADTAVAKNRRLMDHIIKHIRKLDDYTDQEWLWMRVKNCESCWSINTILDDFAERIYDDELYISKERQQKIVTWLENCIRKDGGQVRGRRKVRKSKTRFYDDDETENKLFESWVSMYDAVAGDDEERNADKSAISYETGHWERDMPNSYGFKLLCSMGWNYKPDAGKHPFEGFMSCGPTRSRNGVHCCEDGGWRKKGKIRFVLGDVIPGRIVVPVEVKIADTLTEKVDVVIERDEDLLLTNVEVHGSLFGNSLHIYDIVKYLPKEETADNCVVVYAVFRLLPLLIGDFDRGPRGKFRRLMENFRGQSLQYKSDEKSMWFSIERFDLDVYHQLYVGRACEDIAVDLWLGSSNYDHDIYSIDYTFSSLNLLRYAGYLDRAFRVWLGDDLWKSGYSPIICAKVIYTIKSGLHYDSDIVMCSRDGDVLLLHVAIRRSANYNIENLSISFTYRGCVNREIEHIEHIVGHGDDQEVRFFIVMLFPCIINMMAHGRSRATVTRNARSVRKKD